MMIISHLLLAEVKGALPMGIDLLACRDWAHRGRLGGVSALGTLFRCPLCRGWFPLRGWFPFGVVPHRYKFPFWWLPLLEWCLRIGVYRLLKDGFQYFLSQRLLRVPCRRSTEFSPRVLRVHMAVPLRHSDILVEKVSFLNMIFFSAILLVYTAWPGLAWQQQPQQQPQQRQQ